VDVNALILNLENMLRPLLGEDINFRVVPDPGAARIKADPGQIEQVIMNLAVNARDAMPKGGKLTVTTANVTLDKHRLAICPVCPRVTSLDRGPLTPARE